MRANPVVKVGLLQSASRSDFNLNLNSAMEQIRAAARQGCQIIATPELFLSDYFCREIKNDHFAQAVSIPGPLTRQLSELAAELNIVLIASLFERSLTGLYHNTVVVFNTDGRPLGKYRKVHIPDDPEYYEKYYFTPGQELQCTFDTSFGRIGVLICWDQWFPEAARIAALQGAQILFYPTAIGWHEHEHESLGDAQREAWITIQRSHAIANGIPVCAINRIGHEGPLEFWGSSFITDAFGQIQAQADQSEQILTAAIDRTATESQRQAWPFLRDRRIDQYGQLIQAYQ
ncbi:MAG: carbon-nitrogen hydrolase [Leptospiraceae bacterium]|nr:carbon-nitrogen hydrolase [Leptospiraceae bacterium]